MTDLATTPPLIDFSTVADRDSFEDDVWRTYPGSTGVGVTSGLAVPTAESTYQNFPACAGFAFQETQLAAPCEVWGVIGRMSADGHRIFCLSLGYADELLDEDGVEHGWEFDIASDGSAHLFYSTDTREAHLPPGAFEKNDKVGLAILRESIEIWRVREGVFERLLTVEDSRGRPPGHIWFGSASLPWSPPGGWTDVGGGALPDRSDEAIRGGGPVAQAEVEPESEGLSTDDAATPGLLGNVRSVERAALRGYAASDWSVIDYRMWTAERVSGQFRGPAPPPLEPFGYFVTIGAAQTFGRFCERPFPALLSDELGVPCLNLGLAGAGPGAFLRPDLLGLINNAACVVVQVMSGRSVSNSVFACPDEGGTLQRRGSTHPPQLALDAWREWMTDLETRLGRSAEWESKILELVEENRAAWAGGMAALREAITRPALLLWFSRRDPDYEIDYSRPEHVFGEFPQLIDQPTFDAVAPLFDEVVEATTSRGSPQPLFNRVTGEPYFIEPAYRNPDNSYYPSPEMHEDAAAALLEPLGTTLRGASELVSLEDGP